MTWESWASCCSGGIAATRPAERRGWLFSRRDRPGAGRDATGSESNSDRRVRVVLGRPVGALRVRQADRWLVSGNGADGGLLSIARKRWLRRSRGRARPDLGRRGQSPARPRCQRAPIPARARPARDRARASGQASGVTYGPGTHPSVASRSRSGTRSLVMTAAVIPLSRNRRPASRKRHHAINDQPSREP